jgi:hypothetical protein
MGKNKKFGILLVIVQWMKILVWGTGTYGISLEPAGTVIFHGLDCPIIEYLQFPGVLWGVWCGIP